MDNGRGDYGFWPPLSWASPPWPDPVPGSDAVPVDPLALPPQAEAAAFPPSSFDDQPLQGPPPVCCPFLTAAGQPGPYLYAWLPSPPVLGR